MSINDLAEKTNNKPVKRKGQRLNSQALDYLILLQNNRDDNHMVSSLLSLYGHVVGVGDFINGIASSEAEKVAIAVYEHEIALNGDNVAMTTHETIEISGEYPKYPKHDHIYDKQSTVFTSNSEYTHLNRTDNFPFWHTDNTGYRCEACYHNRVLRISKHVEQEIAGGLSLYMTKLSESEYKKQVKNWLNRKRTSGTMPAYTGLPQSGGDVVLIHSHEDLGGEAIKANRGQIYATIAAYAETPTNKAIGQSKGFGGKFQGMRGDGRAKQAKKEGKKLDTIQGFIPANIKTVCEAIEAKPLASANSITVKIEQMDFIERCVKAGLPLYDHKGDFIITAMIEKLTNNQQEQSTNGTITLETTKKLGLSNGKDTNGQSHRENSVNGKPVNVGNVPTSQRSQRPLPGAWGRGSV